jgi:RimJ/RimL family protein N-acetyltransferase
MRIPLLETERLRIRPLVMEDLDDVHRLLDRELAEVDTGSQGAVSREQRRDWLQWVVLGYEQSAWLHQPPFGERAITARDSGAFLGLVGLVPCLDAFGQLPSLRAGRPPSRASLVLPEVGLYWALLSAHRGQGLATEAARALVDFAFAHLRLERIIAGTEYDNTASQAVMRRLGMTLERNPLPTPPWLQVVGFLENPRSTGPGG